MHTRRIAGIGLLLYGLGTVLAFFFSGAPGGDYQDSAVSDYVASSGWLAAFGFAYLGAFAALGLLVFGRNLRPMLGSAGDLVWGLTVAGAATGVVGWFVDGGLDVAMAEGGRHVQTGVPLPVVYTITEIGNLLAVCSPAFFVGVAACVMAARAPLPRWLRVFSVVAGVCGVLAPLFVTYLVFVLWTLVCGATLATSRGTVIEAAGAQPAHVQPA
ncbi:MAG TPA: hypothetical protein VFO98_01060 [Marmoricola sp.]|nr:hypothetical protein [Marmoricola sp.]